MLKTISPLISPELLKVLAEMGLDAAAVAALRAQGVVG